MYAHINNNTVDMWGLPSTGTISGRTVSNYHLLPADTLKAEGWLPVVETIPEYDPETQTLEIASYEITADSVNVIYIAKDIIAEPDTNERITALEDVVTDMLFSQILGGL